MSEEPREKTAENSREAGGEPAKGDRKVKTAERETAERAERIAEKLAEIASFTREEIGSYLAESIAEIKAEIPVYFDLDLMLSERETAKLAEKLADLGSLFLAIWQKSGREEPIINGRQSEDPIWALLPDLWALIYSQKSPKDPALMSTGRDLDPIWRIFAESPVYTRSKERQQSIAERETAEREERAQRARQIKAAEKLAERAQIIAADYTAESETAKLAERLAERAQRERRAAKLAERETAEKRAQSEREEHRRIILLSSLYRTLAAETAWDLADLWREIATLPEKSPDRIRLSYLLAEIPVWYYRQITHSLFASLTAEDLAERERAQSTDHETAEERRERAAKSEDGITAVPAEEPDHDLPIIADLGDLSSAIMAIFSPHDLAEKLAESIAEILRRDPAMLRKAITAKLAGDLDLDLWRIFASGERDQVIPIFCRSLAESVPAEKLADLLPVLIAGITLPDPALHIPETAEKLADHIMRIWAEEPKGESPQ